MSKKSFIFLAIIVLAAGLLRYCSCRQSHLGGDEAVSLLQASGQAYIYKDEIMSFNVSDELGLPHLVEITGNDLNGLLNITDDYAYGPEDVVKSMKQAGMHPPLYYLYLHYVLGTFGSSMFAVRSASIIFSLVSVILIFFIGKTIRSPRLGLLCAAFFAVCSYPVVFSYMVRPYPMVTCLALAATLFAIRFVNEGQFSFRNVNYWMVVLFLILGLYSIYHFMFHCVFVFCFLFLAAVVMKKKLAPIFVLPVLVALAYIPWLPGLMSQLKQVRSAEYYFHGFPNPIKAIANLPSYNFTCFLPVPTMLSAALVLIIAIIAALGLYSLLKSKTGIVLLLALSLSIAANCIADLMMKTNTICVRKLAFFLIPVSIIVVCMGLNVLLKRSKYYIVLVVLLVALAMANLYFSPNFSYSIDSPHRFGLIEDVKSEIGESDSSVILINTLRRRYILSTAHALKENYNYLLTPRSDELSEQSWSPMLDYNKVILINFDVAEQFSQDRIGDISDILSSDDYSQRLSKEYESASVIVWQRADSE